MMALKSPIFGVAVVQKSKELSLASSLRIATTMVNVTYIHVSEERQNVAFTSMR